MILVDKGRRSLLDELIEITNSKYLSLFLTTNLEGNKALKAQVFDSTEDDSKLIYVLYFSNELQNHTAE